MFQLHWQLLNDCAFALHYVLFISSYIQQDSVLSQGEPRDAAVNFDTYRILLQHRVVSLPLHDFPVYTSDHSNVEFKIMAHDKNQKSRKSHGDHEYVIILQR